MKKQKAYNLIYDITYYIVKNGYVLIGVNGKPTTWGIWSPQYLNDDPDWYDDRGLNSLQILSFLLSAYRITNDKLFINSFNDLVNNYGYGINVINQRIMWPNDINYSDHELAMLTYFTYLWTGATEIQNSVRVSLKRTYKDAKRSYDPFYDFMYYISYGSAETVDLAHSIWTLRNWPLSGIDWPVLNLYRTDVVYEPNQLAYGVIESLTLLPWSEQSFLRWNGDPFDLSGGSGWSETDAGSWLLPYWMGRYYGIIQ